MRPIKPLATHQTLTIVERSLDTRSIRWKY
nr:MAG TPA: hypothetical protein [Caudoviricetes sp.]